MKTATTDPKATRTVIRARGGFGTFEEILWLTERRSDDPAARPFLRMLARVARSFHVQLHLADRTTGLLLPDPSTEGCPSNLWPEIDRAARELDVRLPCPAANISVMALRGELSEGRIDIAPSGRSVVGVPDIPITKAEREWTESYGPAVEEEPDSAASPYTSLQETPATPKAMTLDEVQQYAAVLAAMKNGKIRRVVKPCEIIETTGLPGPRVLQILADLERVGRVLRLKDNRWLVTQL